MSTTPKTAKSIFMEAVEKFRPEEWDVFLAGACGDDVELRARVDDLLKSSQEADSLLDHVDQTVDFPRGELEAGTVIGRYRLMEQIGEGGMGAVFVAEQRKPLRRKVALKVIKPGMDTKAVIARFEAERQALAMMDHPNIAKVLDAGTTEAGRPYFVMELVKGLPITEYCDEKKLTVPERLQLLIQVCQAIQHAHQKAIIHRDIKPSNVLVTERDGRAIPMVIDFGVAKALNQSLTERTLYTSFQSVIGTPLYMSPEQAKLSAVDVDTRSDVYSLGVLLYELLVGVTPFEKDRLASLALEEACRVIREEEPPKPSGRISGLGDTATTMSADRRSDPRSLQLVVRGDLDWIVMTAIDKDRSRRYETTNSLADDITRYLNDEPVRARPPSPAYLLSKFARRNKVAILTGSVVLLVLVVGVLSLSYQARQLATQTGQLAGQAKQLKEERDRVKKERDRARTAEQVAIRNEAAAQDALQRLQLTKDELKQRNTDLRNSLESWTDELVHRAIMAAVSGREEIVEKIIKEAHATGVPPKWEHKVRGLLSAHGGKLNEAIQHLRKAVDLNPKDAGAVATLMRVHLEAGNHSEFIRLKDQLDGLRPETNEDALLVGHAMLYTDIERGERLIQTVVDRQPSPLAFAAHSEALLKLYYKTGDKRYLERAQPERSAAMLLLPDSVWLAVTDFYSNFVLVLDGDASVERATKLEQSLRVLERFGQHPIALHGRASYFDHKDKVDEARELWTRIRDSKMGKWCIVYFAASEYRNGRHEEAIKILDESKTQLLNAHYLGEALALEPKRLDEARKIYDQLTRGPDNVRFGPDDVVAVPESILLLLGDHGLASEKARLRLRDVRIAGWHREMLSFVANPIPDKLIDEAGGHRSKRVAAEKLIASWYLGHRDIPNAQKHLRRCKRAFPLAPEAYWADAIRSRLMDQEQQDWRDWLESRQTDQPPDDGN